jgi:hypothetical protein
MYQVLINARADLRPARHLIMWSFSVLRIIWTSDRQFPEIEIYSAYRFKLMSHDDSCSRWYKLMVYLYCNNRSIMSCCRSSAARIVLLINCQKYKYMSSCRSSLMICSRISLQNYTWVEDHTPFDQQLHNLPIMSS